MVVDIDSFSRKYRKPRIETQEEIIQRMLSVELAIKEALYARGETQFTDQEFPPNDHSLFVDPANPPAKLQVFFFINLYLLLCCISLCKMFWIYRLFPSGRGQMKLPDKTILTVVSAYFQEFQILQMFVRSHVLQLTRKNLEINVCIDSI